MKNQAKINNINKEEDFHDLWHSAAHVMALAVRRLYLGVKLAIGPAIDSGFYFDYQFPVKVKISEEDLPKIEAEMAAIVAEDLPFIQHYRSIEEANRFYKEADQPYKLELVNELASQGEKKLSFYKIGEHDDLCRGPHLKSSGQIKAFKLLSVAGAYWRGDEKNQMLTRIYGVAFPSKKQLQAHLKNLEQIKAYDHRKLGQELDLFCFSDLVGPGLPLYTPRGTALKEALQKEIEQICYKYGFRKVMTPHLAKVKLFELSGHASKFGEELFRIKSDRYSDLAMKPVQCPHQTQIYASKIRSYRDLPIRYMESEKQYRAEKSGELSGFNRVLAITVEDGHSFCQVNQVKDEVKGMVKIIQEFYQALGLWDKVWVSLSVRDYDHPEKYIGEPEDWDICEQMLEEVAKEMALGARRCEGEAAVYGPKLDFMFKDALGRDIQIPTVQVDFATPKRFNLFYINEKGDKVPPVMVHRAILGSYERFLALLIEHFKGNFPLWLAPEQIRILPVKEEHLDYGQKVKEQLDEAGFRVELDKSSEALSAKIKKAQEMKIPYMVIVGDVEISNEKLAIRNRRGDVEKGVELKNLVKLLKTEVEKKT